MKKLKLKMENECVICLGTSETGDVCQGCKL